MFSYLFKPKCLFTLSLLSVTLYVWTPEGVVFNLSIYVQTARCKQQIQLFTSAAPGVKGNQRLNTPTAHSYWWCMLMFSPPSSLCQNQHDELKRQYYDLQEQHQVQGKDHGRLLDEHRERYSKLQQAKEVEILQLNGTYGYESSSSSFFFLILLSSTWTPWFLCPSH